MENNMENIKVDFSDLKRVLDKLLDEYQNNITKWELTITRVGNGYIVEGTDSPSITIEDDEKDVLKSHESLLWEVMSFFNFSGSKHDKERLMIVRKKQK